MSNGEREGVLETDAYGVKVEDGHDGGLRNRNNFFLLAFFAAENVTSGWPLTKRAHVMQISSRFLFIIVNLCSKFDDNIQYHRPDHLWQNSTGFYGEYEVYNASHKR